MPLASWIFFHTYGPHCVSAVGNAVAVSPSALAAVVIESNALGVAVASSPSAPLTDGRRGNALGVAGSSSPQSQIAALARGGAVGKVNTLSQGDVAGALYNLPIENGLTLPEVLRKLLAVIAGEATGLPLNPSYKSQDGSKVRVAGTISGGNRTITYSDPT